MLDLNWQAIATQTVAFILLVLVLNRFAFKPILGMIDQRQAEVVATQEQLAADRAASQAARADYEQRLRNIEAEAREHIQQAVKEAQVLRDQIATEARAQGEALVARAQEEIEREKRKAVIELRTEMAELAVAAASKIIGRTIDPQAQRELLGDFINEVGQA
jgi:F-type H+-transporting ATPase subunit b